MSWTLEAAAIVNNTPLYDNSDHPSEPSAITPAHLMLLKDNPNPAPLESFSSADLNAYGKLRWRRVQHIAEEFWRRWRKNYLCTLQSRSKWGKNTRNVRVKDVVLMKDKSVSRNDWRIAVVDEVFPSKDGVVRSCIVRSVKGKLRRPVNDLVLLIPS